MSKRRATDIPNKAYVTYIGAGNEDELKGVAGLAKGLRQAQSKYPLVVAILSDEYAKKPELLQLLDAKLCSLEKIDPIPFPKADDGHAFKPYFKLGLWKLKKYSRMIYLNADVQVYDNIDYLMDVPEGSCFAVTGCSCEQTGTEIGIGKGTGTGTGTGVGTRTSTGTGVGSGTGTGTGTKRSKIETDTGIGSKTGTGSKQPNTYSYPRCQKCPNTATEPYNGGLPSPLYFNLGLVIFKPDPKTYGYLLEALRNRTTSTLPPSRLENSKIASMYSVISLTGYLILDTPLQGHLTKYEPEKAKVVHYRAVELKPWKKENRLEEKGIKILGKKWMDIYNDKSLDVKNKK